jgi:hypothetical protein
MNLYINNVLRAYFVAGLFIFLFFLDQISDRTSFIFSYHFVTVVLMFIFHFYNTNYNKNFGLSHLLLTVGIISAVYIVLNNIISYIYRENFFVFNEADALEYHNLAIGLMDGNYTIGEVLKQYRATNLDFSDYGMIYFTYINYLIFESNLMVNFSFWVIGLFSTRFMYHISLNFVDKKHAYLATLFLFTSSFIQWFNSSGLKEPIMIFLILMSYFYFYKYLKNKGLTYFLMIIAPLVLLLFFRPAVTLFILFGYFFYFFLQMRVNKYFKNFIILAFVLLFVSTNVVKSEFEKYTGGGTDQMIENLQVEEGMVKGGGLVFNYIVNIIASIFGVFPTVYTDANFGIHKILSVDNRLLLSFHYPGLMLKVFFSTAFLVGFYYSIKNRIVLLIPITFFFITEMFALIFTLEALELRKSLPHFIWFYLFIFYGIYLIEQKNIFAKYKSIFSTVNNLLLIVYFTLIIFWNLR